jgi:hypothetical protein
MDVVNIIIIFQKQQQNLISKNPSWITDDLKILMEGSNIPIIHSYF